MHNMRRRNVIVVDQNDIFTVNRFPAYIVAAGKSTVCFRFYIRNILPAVANLFSGGFGAIIHNYNLEFRSILPFNRF